MAMLQEVKQKHIVDPAMYKKVSDEQIALYQARIDHGVGISSVTMAGLLKYAMQYLPLIAPIPSMINLQHGLADRLGPILSWGAVAGLEVMIFALTEYFIRSLGRWYKDGDMQRGPFLLAASILPLYMAFLLTVVYYNEVKGTADPSPMMWPLLTIIVITILVGNRWIDLIGESVTASSVLEAMVFRVSDLESSIGKSEESHQQFVAQLEKHHGQVETALQARVNELSAQLAQLDQEKGNAAQRHAQALEDMRIAHTGQLQELQNEVQAVASIDPMPVAPAPKGGVSDIKQYIIDNPDATNAEIASAFGKSERTVQRHRTGMQVKS